MGTKTVIIDDTGGDGKWIVRQNALWRLDCEHTVDGVATDITDITITVSITSSNKLSDEVQAVTVTKSATPEDGTWYAEVLIADQGLTPGTYWWAMDWDGTETGEPEPLASGQFVVEEWAPA